MAVAALGDFDGLAGVYERLERLAFGRALERSRTAFLGELRSARRVLVLGEGDGRFLKTLLRVNPVCFVDVVDSSPKMVARARRRLGPKEADRVRFFVRDARVLAFPPHHYDLLVTLFFLDVFNKPTLARLVPALASSLRRGGLWYVADFCVPERGWGRLHALLWLRPLYAFFRVQTRMEAAHLVDPAPLLRAQGLVLLRERVRRSGLLYTRLYVKI